VYTVQVIIATYKYVWMEMSTTAKRRRETLSSWSDAKYLSASYFRASSTNNMKFIVYIIASKLLPILRKITAYNTLHHSLLFLIPTNTKAFIQIKNTKPN
jgi:hypothetical protein